MAKKLDDLSWMAAANGTTKITGTDAVTGLFDGMRIDSDAVVTAILDANGTDITTDVIPDPAETLEAGSTVRGASTWSSIELASGSATAINANIK